MLEVNEYQMDAVYSLSKSVKLIKTEIYFTGYCLNGYVRINT